MEVCVQKQQGRPGQLVVLEMLVDVGIPWNFYLVSELLPRFCWMKCAGCSCTVKVGSSKMDLELISKQLLL